MGAAVMANGLPAGFVLEEEATGLPPGFVLDRRAAGTPEAPPAPEQPAPSFYDRLRDGLTDARAVAGEFAAGANRAVTETLDFIGPDTVNAVLRLTGSERQVPTLTGLLEPTGIQGGFMEPGTARDVVGALGSTVTAGAGMMQVPRNLTTVGGAVAEFLGAGSAKAPGILPAASALDQKLALLRNTGDVNTAGVMLDQAGNVVKDAAAKATTKQGFNEGLVAMIKASTPETRSKMAEMLDIVEKGKANFRYSADNRPLNVVGDSVLNRVKVVREANRVAAVRLDDVANGLRGAQVDINPAVDTFLSTLSEMGMKYDPDTRTLNLVQGSATQDMPKVQKEAARILKRLQTTRENGVLDAYDVHVMKKWIDNNVDYAKSGKGKSGMIGSLDRAIKGLRHDLDATLDTQFPDYNKVNTQYAETRQALNDVQDIAGRKFDPSDDSAALTMGSLTRRFLSNAQSNGYLRDAISNLDATARKYIQPGTDLVPYKPIQRRSGVTPAMLENDDLIGMALYADELDKMFGAASRTSLLGDVEKGVNTGIDAALGQKTAAGMTADAAKWAYNKARGVNEQNAIKAMRELLKRGTQ